MATSFSWCFFLRFMWHTTLLYPSPSSSHSSFELKLTCLYCDSQTLITPLINSNSTVTPWGLASTCLQTSLVMMCFRKFCFRHSTTLPLLSWLSTISTLFRLAEFFSFMAISCSSPQYLIIWKYQTTSKKFTVFKYHI